MKKFLTFIVAIVNVATVCGQPFEGKITYQNSFKSKVENMTDQKFNSMMGTRQEYFIKGGNYKSVTNGTYSQWQLYINKDNEWYSKLGNSETVYWNDAGRNDDSVISVKLNKEVIEILGNKCDELIMNCKSGTQKYYFNSKYGVDTKLYAHHNYGNWYEYLKQANAVPLKMIIDNQQFTMESVAIEIKPMKLDEKEFKLPANVKTQKSPF